MFMLKNEGRRRKKIRYMRARGWARPGQLTGIWGLCKAWGGTAVPL